jgi:hypothetical protein
MNGCVDLYHSRILRRLGIEKNGRDLSLKLALQTDEFPEWKTKAEIMQQDLKNVGIIWHERIRIRTIENKIIIFSDSECFIIRLGI